MSPSGPGPTPGAGSRAGSGRRLSWVVVAWVGILVVIVAGLVVGSGVLDPPRPTTPAARISALEHELRCPSCADLSVAVSSASTAVAVRHYIVQQVDAGQSNAAIVAYLKSRYGPGILLVPPARGAGLAIVVLPIGLGVALVVGVAILFLRRRDAGDDGPSGTANDDESLVAAALADRRAR